MKIRKTLAGFFFMAALMGSTAAVAQVSHGGEPLYNHSKMKAVVPAYDLPRVDSERLLGEDMQGAKGAGPMRVAVVEPVDLDIVKHASKIHHDGATTYFHAVSSPNATFIGLAFSQFDLPEGAQLFLYDQSGDFVLGSFNGSDLRPDGTFFTQAIPSNVANIELTVPDGSGSARLVLGEVELGYKDIFAVMDDNADFQNGKGSHGVAEGRCHINVACPEGDDYRDIIRSTVAISITAAGAMYMCSGALINNTRQDRTPYVLSAYHCQDEDLLGGTVSRYVTYFLYNTSTCESNSGSSGKSIAGATVKAKWSSYGGSDFLLLQLDRDVPETYTPYYAGWDRNDLATHEPGVAIHHPGGDYKKLSFPRQIKRAAGNYNKFYQVSWFTGTQNKGVTEQGSSGSPIFNAEKRIIGQLYAGSSSCTQTSGSDYYGRVFSSWTGNNSDETRLSTWLDPDGTDVTTLDGIDYSDSATVSINQVIEANTLTVYPNPSTGVVHFDVDALGDANYKVYDLGGRCLLEGRTVLTSTVQAIDLSALPKGSYILHLFTPSRRYSTTVIIR